MAEEDNSQKGRSLYYQRFTKDALPGGAPAYSSPAYGAAYGSAYGSAAGAPEGEGGSMSVGRILRVCSSHWMTIFVFLVLGLLSAFVVFQLLPQKFEAEAYYEMTIQGPSLVSDDGNGMYSGIDTSLESVFNTRYTQFQTTEIQDRVIERYRAKNPDDGTATQTFRDIFKEDFEMELLPRSRLVRTTIVAGDPKLAADLANAYIEVCEEFMSEQNKALAENAVAFLTQTLAEEERRLAETEEDLLEERKSQRIENLTRERELVQSRLSALDSQSIELERQIAIAKDLISALAIVKETPERFTVIPEDYRSAEIVTAYERWQTALNERKTLLIRLTEKHPDVILKDREVQVFREQFVEVAQRAYDTGLTQVKFLESQRQPIVEEAAKVRAEIIKLDGDIIAAQMRVQQLERQREIGIGKTSDLRERQRVASLKADENAAAIKSVRDAIPPDKPASPNPYIIFSAGVIIGLLLGVLFVLLLDHMEDKLAGVADIEQRLRLKALVVFPHLRRLQRSQVALTMHNAPFSQYAESMAGLRNLLDSPRYHDLTKVILCMSTQPSEGKTCTSTNLAIAYAQSGQRTLLVDFDMRRPRLAGIFGRDPNSFPSLPHVLAKNDPNAFADLPQDSQVPNLHIVYSRASGSISPSVLMGTNIITDFFAWARKNYDHIIIDSPPFGLVGDVIVLANLADSVLLVATPDKTRFGPIQFASRRLTEVGAKILGVIVNNVDFGRWSGFGNYSSRYGYTTKTYIPREARDLPGAKGSPNDPAKRHAKHADKQADKPAPEPDAPAPKADKDAPKPSETPFDLPPDDRPLDDSLTDDD